MYINIYKYTHIESAECSSNALAPPQSIEYMYVHAHNLNHHTYTHIHTYVYINMHIYVHMCVYVKYIYVQHM